MKPEGDGRFYRSSLGHQTSETGPPTSAGFSRNLQVTITMTYVKSNNRSVGRSALSGTVSDAASAVLNVAQDPCLLEVAKRTSRLADLLHKAQQPGVPSPKVRGIGLCSAVRPLKVVTFIAEKPWIVPVGVTVLFGTLVGLGYMIGRGR